MYPAAIQVKPERHLFRLKKSSLWLTGSFIWHLILGAFSANLNTLLVEPMEKQSRQELLLKAQEAFNRRVCVISPRFKLLASTGVDRLPPEDCDMPHCYECIYGRIEVCENCPAEKVLATGRPAMREVVSYSKHRNGTFCLYAYPVPASGPLESIAILNFDFPALEGLEEELSRSNAFLHNLIQSACDGVIATDMQGKIIIFNDAAAECTGYSVEEALSSLNIRDFYEGDGAREVMRRLRSEKYGGKGKLKKFRITALGKNGAKIPISLYAAIIYEDQKEIATIGFFHDLRETIHMQEKLAKTQRQLLQSEKMASLGKLAAGVAHQLNNPLGSITLYTKLILEEYDLEDDLRADLQRILKDAQRCSTTVRELLAFARQNKQFMKPVNINQVIEQTLSLIVNQALFQNIKIKKHMAPFLPMVKADGQQLNHVFMNLFINAAQAIDGSGTIEISTSTNASRDRVIIRVRDDGPGIEEDVIKHIFEPFFTTKQEGQGTGLGLSVVFNIIENHGGNICAKSRPGDGTTFTIELPIIYEQKRGDGNEALG